MNCPLNTTKSISLIELLVSIVIVTMMVLSFYSLETFSQGQVINSERRAKVQNQLTYVLEHMSKYVQQANGNINDPGIELFPPGNPTGFQVRVDFNGTPLDPTDDPWVRYRLRQPNNILEVSCNGGLGCPASFSEDLTAKDKVCSGFVGDSSLPKPFPPANPSGFYVWIEDGGCSINIGLVGRYVSAAGASLGNPEVAIKTKLICNNCSAN
jgi:type II secretory pathway pseudopilin PulG